VDELGETASRCGRGEEIPLLIRQFIDAEYLEEAASAAADLFDLICREVIEEAAVPVTTIFVALLNRTDFKWRALALQILDMVARSVLNQQTAPWMIRIRCDTKLGKRAYAELSRAKPLVERLLEDADPEVRAVAGRLFTRLALPIGSAIPRLIRLYGDEQNPVTKADLAESIIWAAINSTDEDARKTGYGWAKEELSSPFAVVRYRIAITIEPVAAVAGIDEASLRSVIEADREEGELATGRPS